MRGRKRVGEERRLHGVRVQTHQPRLAVRTAHAGEEERSSGLAAHEPERLGQPQRLEDLGDVAGLERVQAQAQRHNHDERRGPGRRREARVSGGALRRPNSLARVEGRVGALERVVVRFGHGRVLVRLGRVVGVPRHLVQDLFHTKGFLDRRHRYRDGRPAKLAAVELAEVAEDVRGDGGAVPLAGQHVVLLAALHEVVDGVDRVRRRRIHEPGKHAAPPRLGALARGGARVEVAS
mmetsp:Transcript_7427/g.22828  ORF Transcript_7427/g.22828 Transcript_7427/m.22828 type:complete len:236 (+) Transcript_7427:287-994(+)